MSTSRETIAVAIDFGTTYSGVAFMKINNRSEDQVPTQLGEWPGLPNSSTDYKVPTIVVYPENEGTVLWGFEAKRAALTAQRKETMFKPFLDPMFTRGQHSITGLTKVVHDYIQGLYTHLIYYLKKEGISNTKTDLCFLLTVPATFRNDVVEKFRRIIKNTGIGSHNFAVNLTEPEAAGLYTMQVMPEQTKSAYNEKGCFIVCDAGGATIDLSSYNILQFNPIRVEHTGVLSGKYCGSIFIDSAFESHLQSPEGGAFWKDLAPAEQESMIASFIKQKERFDNSPYDDNINIELPPRIECPGKKGPYLALSREQMQGFFTESLLGIRAMIETHIERCRAKGYRVSYIFLVGGLGSSVYTKQKIEEYFDVDSSGIKVVQPPEAQQAVVLGAISNQMRLLRRESDPVQVRICPKFYGIVTMKSTNAVDLGDKEYKDPISGRILSSRDQITWLFQKGDRITNGSERHIEQHFTREFVTCNEGWEEVVVEYSGGDPPHHMGPEVTKVCTLVPNLSSCPKSDFAKLRMKKPGFFSRRVKFYQARYTIKVYLGTTGLRFEMLYRDALRPDLMKVVWDMDKPGVRAQ